MANNGTGVQIPVIIDIDQACQDAAARVAKALQPLKQQVEANALKLRLQVDSGKKMNLGRILDDATLSSKQLQNALNDVEAKISKIAAKRKGFDFIGGITDKEKQLLQAYAILEKRITGIGSTSTVTARLIQTKLAQLRAELSKLEAKLKTIDPGTTKFRNVSSQILQTKNSIAQLSAEYSRFAASTSQYNANMQAFNGTMRRQYGLWGQLASAATMYVSVFGLFRFAKQIRDVTAELEYQRVALGHLIQDEEYGARLFEQIKGLAIESPFRIKDLVTYTKQLAAYRIENENLFDTTKRLADISAGLGVDMNRLILAYGQVRAASVLRGQELRQFTEAGIPLVELLADKFSDLRGQMVSTADVFKLISERAVPFSMIAEIFEDLTDKGGTFYEMQKTQADTLKGKWEKLKDAFDIGLQTIGESSTARFEMDALLWVLNRVAKNLQVIPKLLGAATTAWLIYTAANIRAAFATKTAVTAQQAEIIMTKVRNTQISGLVTKIYGQAAAEAMLTKAVTAQATATNFAARAWAGLRIAMLANPIGVVLAAVGALIAAFTLFRKKTEDVSRSLSEYNKAIEKVAQSESQYHKMQKTIDTYDRLVHETERTAKENMRLDRTLQILRESFPEVALSVDKENESLDENIKKLKEISQLKREEGLEEARKQLDVAKQNLDALKAQREELQAQRDDAYQNMKAWERQLEINKNSANLMNKLWNNRQVKKNAENAAAEFKRLDDEIVEINGGIEKTEKTIVDLEKYINPDSVTKNLSQWQLQLQNMQKIVVDSQEYTLPGVENTDIEGYESLHQALKKIEKSYKDAASSAEELGNQLAKMREKQKSGSLEAPWSIDAIQKEYNLAAEQAKGLKAILDFFGYALSGGGRGGSSYQKPKFITDMEESIKFMKDFKKGYDELSKHITRESALNRESEIMKNRGMVLGMDVEEQKRAATDLLGWYRDQLDKTMAEMKKSGGRGNTLQDLLSMDVGKNKKLKDYQELLLSLADAITDLENADWDKKLEKALSDLADKVKRSEAAKKFYESIFDLTGDKEMAMSMSLAVYGDTGKDLEENIRKQLETAFVLDSDKISKAGESYDKIAKAVTEAIASGNYGELDKYLDFVVDKNKSTATTIVQNWQKRNEEIASSFAKLALKFDELEQQRVNITNKAAKERETVEKGVALEILGIEKEYNAKIEAAQDEAEKLRLQKAKENAIAEARARGEILLQGITRDEEYELYKLTRQYRLFFTTVGVLSKESARKVYEAARKMLTEQFAQGQMSLARYRRELAALDDQMKKNNQSQNLFVNYLSGGVEGLVSKIKDYSEGLQGIVATIAKNKEDGSAIFGEGDKEYIDKMGKIFGGKVFGVSGRKDVFNKLVEKYKGDAEGLKKALSEASSQIATMGEGFAQGVAIADLWVQNIGNAIIELDKLANTGEEAAGWWNDVANVLMKIPTLGFSKSSDAGDRLAEMNEYAMQGFEKFKSGNFIGAFADTIRSWGAMFGPSVKAINRQIKEQQRLIDELSYEYGRLDVAIDKAFGESYIYNYNKQLENLQAQQAAYLKQAELERSKGKKKDKDKIKDYEDKARETADKIADMQTQLSEFFTDTDLTSAAEDFANAWIEAYKEFANTTGAMREKFEEMIKSMITRSLAAKLMQSILQPLFDQIDAMAKDGDLSAQEISEVARVAPEYVNKMNEAMTTMANDLAAAGYNLRGSSSSLTGISRNIAEASEESILGLSAAINTQNFYISRIPSIDEKMSQIIALMGGSTATGGTATGEAPEVDLKLQYLSYLPTMASDVNEILINLKRVISPMGANTATHYIAIR